MNMDLSVRDYLLGIGFDDGHQDKSRGLIEVEAPRNISLEIFIAICVLISKTREIKNPNHSKLMNKVQDFQINLKM